jgi:hypothetical protein
MKEDYSENAGARLSFYSKNIVINNTNQKLMLYYDKNTKVAG